MMASTAETRGDRGAPATASIRCRVRPDAGGRTRPGGALVTMERVGLVLLALALAGTALVGLAACGSDEGTVSSSASSPPTDTAAHAAREVLVAFLDMLERAEFDDLERVATARYVANHERSADAPLDEVRLIDMTMRAQQDGTTMAQLSVYLDPGPEPGPWGTEAGERTLFASLVPSADGGWLIDDLGTGP
jgi:hypothetical protein